MWAPHPLQLPGTRSTPPKDPRPLRESHPSSRLGQDASPLLPVSVEWPAPFAPGHMTADRTALPRVEGRFSAAGRHAGAGDPLGSRGAQSRQGFLGRGRGQHRGAQSAGRTSRTPGPRCPCHAAPSPRTPAGLTCEDLSRSCHFSRLEPVDQHGSESWAAFRRAEWTVR